MILKHKHLKSLFLITALLISNPAHSVEKKTNKDTASPEEFIEGPYSGYGEFGSTDDEAEDEKFFQRGRLFGIALGGGVTVPTGNAAKLYQGGVPTLDFRLMTWFDFHFALSLGIQNSEHSYDVKPDGLTKVTLFRFIPQIKYYFDTTNASAPVTFIGPHLIVGAGLYKRTDNIGAGLGATSAVATTVEQQTVGFNAGAGLEMTIRPKKTYLNLEGVIHMAAFNDQFDGRFSASGIPNRTGNWWSFSALLLFTW